MEEYRRVKQAQDSGEDSCCKWLYLFKKFYCDSCEVTHGFTKHVYIV